MTNGQVERVLRELGDRISDFKITEKNTTHYNETLKKINADRSYRNKLFLSRVSTENAFMLKKQTVVEGEEGKLKRESEILLELQSEYLFHRYAVFLGNNCLYILMKAYLSPDGNPNTLDTLLKKGGFSLANSLKYIDRLHKGINYLHTRNLILATGKSGPVIHRDLKPENIFIEDDGTPVIGDFEFSTIASKSYAYYNGSVEYWAPEVGTEKITEHFFSSDIYSLATMVFDMLSEDSHELGKSKFWKGYDREKIKVIKRKQKSIDEVFEKRRKEFPYKHILDVLRVAMRTNPEKRYADVNVFFKDFLLAKALEEMKDVKLKKRLSDLEKIIEGQNGTEYAFTTKEKLFGEEETYEEETYAGETEPGELLKDFSEPSEGTKPDKLHFLSPDIMSERYELFQRLSEFLKRPLNDFDLDGAKLDESLGALAGVNNRVRLDLFWMMAYLSRAIPVSESGEFRKKNPDEKSKYIKEKLEKLGKNFAAFENMHKEMSKIWKAYQGKSGEKK